MVRSLVQIIRLICCHPKGQTRLGLAWCRGGVLLCRSHFMVTHEASDAKQSVICLCLGFLGILSLLPDDAHAHAVR